MTLRQSLTYPRQYFVLALLAAAGCAHGTLSPASPGTIPPPGRGVGSVVVTLAPSVAADRRAACEELGGNDAIAREIIARLEREERYSPAGDTRVDVTVNVFRLRSAGNAFWNGFLAGVDMLEGEVMVSSANGQAARYDFKLSGSEEMYLKFSAAARFRSLARTLAARVSELFRPATT